MCFFRPLRGLNSCIHRQPPGLRLGLPSGARFAGLPLGRAGRPICGLAPGMAPGFAS